MSVDIVQRILEALQESDEPFSTASGQAGDGSVVVGSLPKHLRHFHNLLSCVAAEAAEAEAAYERKKDIFDAVRAVFFHAVKETFPEAGKAQNLTILTNWDVAVGSVDADDDDDHDDTANPIADLVAALVAR